MDCQSPDGWFQWGGQAAYGGTIPSDPDRELTNDDIDIVSEFTVWLALIGSNLLARDGG
jgi:hypothetical protein